MTGKKQLIILGSLMRKFIRHPADIPIDIEIGNVAAEHKETLTNVSRGGLAFQSKLKIDVDTIITIKFTHIQPEFTTKGYVTWCKPMGLYYDIGVQIINQAEAHQTRMIEQICHIEHYKRAISETEGRKLSGEEAAFEWISKYADDFPKLEAI